MYAHQKASLPLSSIHISQQLRSNGARGENGEHFA
jgi:hypothetical protein